MNISITPALDAYVQSQIASGQFQSASEVVRDSLRQSQERTIARDAVLAKLRADIAEGFEQLKRGEVIPGDIAMEELRERSRRYRAEHR